MELFGNVAVSSTTTYKSKVTLASGNRCTYLSAPTGTATGAISREINYLGDEAYNQAVAAASGSTREEREANNTTGWVTQSFLQSDVTNAAATMPVSGTATAVADMPPIRARTRLSYLNATNTGNLRVYMIQTPVI